MKPKLKKQIAEFLKESNAIEGIFSPVALVDAQEAWDFALANPNKFTIPWLLEIHRILLQRLDPEIAGKLRKQDVYIGGRTCKFLGTQKLKEDLETALERMQMTREKAESIGAYKTKYAKFCHV